MKHPVFLLEPEIPQDDGEDTFKERGAAEHFFLSLSEALELMQNLHPCLQSFRR